MREFLPRLRDSVVGLLTTPLGGGIDQPGFFTRPDSSEDNKNKKQKVPNVGEPRTQYPVPSSPNLITLHFFPVSRLRSPCLVTLGVNPVVN